MLHLLDRRVEVLDHGLVVVDHLVDDRVQRRAGAAAEQVRPLLEPEADVVQRGLAVAHGEDEAVADEQQDLAEEDVAVLLARGLQDEKDRLAVDLELRTLMRLDRVLDRELVEVELAPHRLELALARLVEADPDERAGAERLVCVLEREVAGAPAPSSYTAQSTITGQVSPVRQPGR